MEWSAGLPTSPSSGTGLFLNYLKLEQYEDTLNNIAFAENIDEQTGQLVKLPFEQVLRYVLRNGTSDSSSLLSVNRFLQPFDYEMDIVQLNERKPTNVDLLATFNFLLGLEVHGITTETHQERTYRFATGLKGKQQYAIVWRNYDDKLDLKKERNWIQKHEWHSSETQCYCNADNAFGAASTEDEFRRLMFEETNS